MADSQNPQSLDSLFQESGVDLNQISQQVQAKNSEAAKAVVQNLHQKEQAVQDAGQIPGAVQQVLGVGVGVRDILKHTYNGLATLAGASDEYKWDDKEGAQGAANLDETGKAAKAVTDFAAPLVATMAAGGGFALASGVNAAYNFLAVDPKAPGVADALKGTFVEQLPIAMNAIQHLSIKPTDTELEGRLKHMFTSLGLDAALGSLFYGASKAYQGISALKNPKVLQGIAESLDNAKAPVAAVSNDAKTAAATDAATVTSKEQQILNNSDQAISSGATNNPEEAAMFQKQYEALGLGPHEIKMTPEGTIQVNAANEDFVDKMGAIMDADPKAAKVLRTPTTDAETLAAVKIMKDDPEVLKSINAWDGTRGLTDKETLVAKYALGQMDASVGALAKAVESGGDIERLNLARGLKNLTRLNEIKTGSGSQNAAALRSNQILGQLAGVGDKEALQAIGAQGRAQMMDDMIKMYGGRENIDKMAKNINFIKDISDIAAIPNKEFSQRMGQVVQRTAFMKIEDALTSVALNGMLSAPTTVARQFVANTFTAAKMIVDNYIASGLGAALNSKDAMLFAEADASAKGMMGALVKSWKPAAESFTTGVAPQSAMLKLELKEAARAPISDVVEMAQRSAAKWGEKVGVAVPSAETAAKVGATLDKAISAPERALLAGDTYWQEATRAAVIEREGMRIAKAQGITDANKIADFMDNFRSNVPAAVDKMANTIAGTNTFAKELEGGYKTLQDVFVKPITEHLPFGRVIMPFTKSALNGLEYTILNSPIAFIDSSFRQAISTGGRARDEALAKIISGSTAVAGFAYLAHAGLVHGKVEDWQVEKALNNGISSAQEASVKVGDKWISVKGLEPLNTIINGASMLSKASGYLKDGEMTQASHEFLALAAEIVTPEMLTSNLKQVMDLFASKDPEKTITAYAADVATRFVPYSSALKATTKMVDDRSKNINADESNGKDLGPLTRWMELTQHKLSAMVPFYSKELPGHRNLWGEKVHLPDGIGPDIMSPISWADDKGQAIKQTLQNMDKYAELMKGTNANLDNFNIQMPPKEIKNSFASTRYTMSPKEYEAYTLYNAGIDAKTGKTLPTGLLKDKVMSTLTKYDLIGRQPNEIQPQVYQAALGELSKYFTQNRAMASQMILQFGDVGKKMQKQAQDFMKFQQGPTLQQ